MKGKRIPIWLMSVLILCGLTACAGQPNTSTDEPHPSETSVTAAVTTGTSGGTESRSAAPEERRLKMTVEGQEIGITLYDTPTADALYEALPMTLSFSDYNDTEKIAYPPQTLPTVGEPEGCDPAVGDLCLYAPWGNLCIFYRDFGYSVSLVKLGHVDSGMETLADMHGDFTVTLERAA